jgi:hypothetical protein
MISFESSWSIRMSAKDLSFSILSRMSKAARRGFLVDKEYFLSGVRIGAKLDHYKHFAQNCKLLGDLT